MTTFLKGDTTATIALALAEGFDYSGKRVCLEYQGVRRVFANAVAGCSLTFSFTADETVPMSLGAYPVRVWLVDGSGAITTVHNSAVKFRVTDNAADVSAGGAIYVDVHGGLYGIDGLPDRWNENDLRAKINEIIRRLGGTVAMLLACVLPALGGALTVQTAPKCEIYNDERIVTNVTFDASSLATPGDVHAAAQAATNYVDSLGAYVVQEIGTVKDTIDSKVDIDFTTVVVTSKVVVVSGNDYWTCDWNGKVLRKDPERYSPYDPTYWGEGDALLYARSPQIDDRSWKWILVDGEEIGRAPYDPNALSIDFGNGHTLTRGGYTIVTNEVSEPLNAPVAYTRGSERNFTRPVSATVPLLIRAVDNPDGTRDYYFFDLETP